MKKRNVFLLLLAAVILTGAISSGLTAVLLRDRTHSSSGVEGALNYHELAKLEKEWILKNQLPDGAILNREWEGKEDSQTMVPYFSNIAVLGLLSGSVSEKSAEGARAYLQWYLDHLNTEEDDPENGDGTMYDYRVTLKHGETHVESTGSCDSVDSYAASFLMAADVYADKVGTSMLAQRLPDLKRVIDSMLRIIHKNNLSQVSATNPTQFLMDNCEVYGGLISAVHLLEKIEPDGRLLKRLEGVSGRLQEAVEQRLWDEQAQVYHVGIQKGKRVETQPGNFYPDDTAQLFPIVYHLLDPEGKRAVDLYKRFSQTWNWEKMDHYLMGQSEFYWCMLAYTGALMGDERRVESFTAQYYRTLLQEGRGYPLHVGEAGWMALCFSEME